MEEGSASGARGNEGRVNARTDRVNERDMALLDMGGSLRRDCDAAIDGAFEFAARHAGKSGRPGFEFFGLFNPFDDGLRIAARRESHHHVALANKRLDLAGENIIVAVVIGDRGERRSIGCERDGRESLTIGFEMT